MPISSALKVRNKSIRATYALITDDAVHCKKNVPISPFTPITGLNGKPFVDATTGDKYYEYYLDPSGSPLPAGLTLNSRTGQVTGTPTTANVVSATVFGANCKFAVRDSRNKRAYKESSVTIIVTEPLTATLPTNNKIVGVANRLTVDFSIFATITGGRPPYVYSVKQGDLPADVKIDQPTGKLTGKTTETKRTFTDVSQTEVLPLTSPVLIEAQDFYGDVITSTIQFDIIDTIIAVPHMDATDSTKNFVIKGVIPLAVNYTAFNSVLAGTPPYTYVSDPKQKDPYPTGVTLNATTGVLSGTYNSTSEYTGTIQIAVKDSLGDMSSKIAKVDINAYLPFVVTPADSVAGVPLAEYEKIELKAIDIKPLKGKYGAPPYTFSVVSCKYTNKTGAVYNTATLPAGLTLTAADSSLKSTAGLATGLYEITFDAVDSANTHAAGIPVVKLTISDAVAATSLITTKSYEMYVGDNTSALSTGFNVIQAELGIPPYTFKVEPALPAGMIFTTLPTKCFINGTPSEAVDKDYVFSVKDSTGMQAKFTETIHLKIVAHLTSSADVTDIDAFIDDLVDPIDIFSKIEGGYPPYTVKLLTGTLRPELSILPMDFKYYDTAAAKDITVETPQIWGNALITGAGTGTPIKGVNNVYGYVSQDTYTFSVSDSKGETSPNIATLNFNIFKPIKGVATKIPPVITGIAEYTTVNFKPITPIDGVPPYTIGITKSITNTKVKPSKKTTYPSLGLKAVQPDTIAGIPNAGYKGYLYYYLTDKTGGRTNNIAVSVDITPKIAAEKYTNPIEVLYVKGYPKYEITDKSASTPVVTLADDLKLPFFKSVTGGATPYVYYETDSAGKAVATSKIPSGYYIDSFGNLSTNGTAPVAAPTVTMYAAVADSNLVRATDVSGIKMTINDVLSTELVDNIKENATAVTSFDATKSNTVVTKQIDDSFNPFKLVTGKNGSGRYSYMFDLTTVSAMPVLDYFQINGTTGEIKQKPGTAGALSSKFASIIDVTFGIRVTDTFTSAYKNVQNVLRLTTVNKLTITAINASVMYEKDSTHLNDPVFTITGGSGAYDFVSCTPPLPAPMAFTSTDGTNAAGGITGAASSVFAETQYTVVYKDRNYNKTVSGTFKLSVTSDYVVVPFNSAVTTGAAIVNLAKIQTVSKMTASQLLSTPVKIRIEVNANLSSNDIIKPALTVSLASGLHADTTIKIITKTGSIVGCGGEGGKPSTSRSTSNGKNGGPALKLDTNNLAVDIECSPGTFISGGGGGGGAGAIGWRYYKGRTIYLKPSVDYTGGNTYKYDYPTLGSPLVWVAAGGIPLAKQRKTFQVTTDYDPSDVYSTLFTAAPIASLNFVLPDPLPATPSYGDFKYSFKAYSTSWTKWDFANGKNPFGTSAAIYPQLDKFFSSTSATSIPSSYRGGDGFGYGGLLTATAGGEGKVANSQIYKIGATTNKITFTDPRPINYDKMLVYAAGTATDITIPYLETLGIKDGNIYVTEWSNAEGSAAIDGQGISSGKAGINPDMTKYTDPYNYIPYFGGGGGGGMGSDGGDGAQVSSAVPTSLPPATVTNLTNGGEGGLGGTAGPAILTTTATQLPTLTTPGLVYGDVL